MRRATAACVCAGLLAVAAPTAGAASSSPAKQLGAAYRAFESGDYDKALGLARKLDRTKLRNPDYALWIAAQSAFLTGGYDKALIDFSSLAEMKRSRFARVASWRRADCMWQLGKTADARGAYETLLGRSAQDASPDADLALARFRIADARSRAGDRRGAIAGFQAFRLRHPAHPLEERAARRLVELAGASAAVLSAEDRIERARRLTAAKDWHEAIAELSQIPDDASADVRRRRDYWTGMTLFKMRRQYGRAGEILLGLHAQMGSEADRALFHGARALSRADRDEEAVRWYKLVVDKYPSSQWAAEAQYLSGWLYFNMGKYRAGIPGLERAKKVYSRSQWATEASWYLGLSHYLLEDYAKALPYFEELAGRGGALEGGKGRYWRARTLQKLGKPKDARPIYEGIVDAHPFSWYALLARSRLKEQGVDIGPFGKSPRTADSAPAIADKLDPELAADDLIRQVDELIAAGLGIEAGRELQRGERGFFKRHAKPDAMAMLMDRYRKAGNFNRPWMLAVVHGGSRALDSEPKGRARTWWEHAYPLAYRELVDRYRDVGKNPPYYLHAIMRKESGFDPHVHSYADAIGLLQMIPPTTRRVVHHLGLEYAEDLLWDPELNVKTGSWYIGHLLAKFKRQIPFGAGAFNGGPAPIMKWLDQWGDRPMDEFIELAAYTQTREYMKKVTESYARYLYLYDGVVYEQPLVVDRSYVRNDLTY